MNKRSIVQDLGVEKSGCGYCGGNKQVVSDKRGEQNVSSSKHTVSKRNRPKTRVAHGMWAHQLTVEDYEELMTRGWRRSGKYVYRPDNAESCCQQFAIRLDVENFVPSKSQRRALKRMERVSSSFDKDYDGERSQQVSVSQEDGKETRDYLLEEIRTCLCRLVQETVCEEASLWGWKVWRNSKNISKLGKYSSNLILVLAERRANESMEDSMNSEYLATETDAKQKRQVAFSRWKDYYTSILKDAAKNMFADLHIDCTITSNGFINFWKQDDSGNQNGTRVTKKKDAMQPSHGINPEQVATRNSRLNIKLELPKLEDESFLLFQRYQQAVHNESPKENSKESFSRFLVDTPLIFVEPKGDRTTPSCGFGTFHMKYYLDERLIAVGVVDVLPHYLSSVYFFYDPSYGKFSLGVYSALQEIEWVRMQSLQGYSAMQYYCMGFYIHDCPKMRYKGEYFPSQLRCEVTGQWIQLEVARTILNKHNGRALRLAPDDFPIDEYYLVVPCERVFSLISTYDKERYRRLWHEALVKVPLWVHGKLLVLDNLKQSLNDKLSLHIQSVLLSYIAKVGPQLSTRMIYVL